MRGTGTPSSSASRSRSPRGSRRGRSSRSIGGAARSRPTHISSDASAAGRATYALVCYLLTQLARVGTILFGVSFALSELTGLADRGHHPRDRPARHPLHAPRRYRGRHLDRRGAERRPHRGRSSRRGAAPVEHARGTRAALRHRVGRRKVRPRERRARPHVVHDLGRAPLRHLHQPQQLRDRSELHPALPHGAERRPRRSARSGSPPASISRSRSCSSSSARASSRSIRCSPSPGFSRTAPFRTSSRMPFRPEWRG